MELRASLATILFRCSVYIEKTGRWLLGKFWWINSPDDKGRTALAEAKEAHVPWLVDLLLNPSSIQKEPFDWITACERDETSAVIAFIDNCHDLQKVFREQNDTPLHHIKLPTYKDYMNFLKNPSIAEIKNTTDHGGATPLHRALERKDILLAKTLLNDNGVERNIEDYHDTTAMDLLAKLCKENEDWARMCKQIKVNPYLKTTYIQPGTNLDQMRNTLSVVAALLATITFAAGFTLPGGLNNANGDAILAKKASFLVFLLADAYAMCASMLVLFCLIWSMVSERDMSYLLVDRSVVILMQALYGTMVAFMTGIYSAIARSSLWAAIIIFVMCSFIGISANRTVLHNVLAKLIPAANHDWKYRIRLLEEGKASVAALAGNDVSQKTK
ncbi:protein ACCELERATED CELL DEATH 6-like [Chenopodium quinoa]|uniref:protein ACCELERATED CELL DEATH 6-like n=1 Tax=Chenopodium quinoa TaxID=63459 RepID=UPI000B773A8F|nr:protein ACCELERATED CELL DEATH 6-like [Chenopodium quinoa]